MTEMDDPKTAAFDIENSDPQPGAILDQEKYDAAIKSGKLTEIPATEPNIIFCRKVESKGETVPAEPPLFINDGTEKIELPPSAEQLKGFFHPQAGRIIAAMPKAYKRLEKKGAK